MPSIPPFLLPNSNDPQPTPLLRYSVTASGSAFFLNPSTNASFIPTLPHGHTAHPYPLPLTPSPATFELSRDPPTGSIQYNRKNGHKIESMPLLNPSLRLPWILAHFGSTEHVCAYVGGKEPSHGPLQIATYTHIYACVKQPKTKYTHEHA